MTMLLRSNRVHLAFQRFILWHETVWCPSKTIENGVFLCFFLVDWSRRKAVLLRGGPRRKGWGGISTYTCPTFPCTLERLSVILVVHNQTATAVLLVVLLYGAVVSQAPAVVPLGVMVVPLLWSLSTVALRPSAAPVR